jgi:hypothetical protein
MSGLANVRIDKKNGALGGVVPSNDGEALLIVATFGVYATATGGVTAQNLISNNDVFRSYTKYEDFLLNYSTDYDAQQGVLFKHHVKKYFEASSNKLHVMQVNLATTFDNIFTDGNGNNTALKNYLQLQNGAIKLIGIALNPNFVEANTNGVPTNLSSEITKAQAFVADEFGNGRPVHVLLEGRGVDFTSSTLLDLRTKAAAGVSVVAWQNTDVPTTIPTTITIASVVHTFSVNVGRYAEVGYTLGLLSAVPVQRNIGRVKNGAVSYTTNVASSSGQLITGLAKATRNTVADKGYVFATKHPQLEGYYVSDDPTCVAVTDDYSWITRNRVINKAATITRRVYNQSILDEVYTDPDTGKLSALTIKNFESEVEQAVSLEMIRNGEATAVEAYVNPEQDVLTTGEIVIEIRIVPVGIARYIVAKIGFSKVI